jgi:glycosyltransferase involved in cell wall biosynthesis
MKSTDYPNLSGCYLSVIVITYNHENYLRKCLDSILMQEVDFDFEIIIGDDCSPDSTAKIINDYYERYPDVVRPTLRSQNVGATRNQYDCFLQAKGKYIAILDGDDFWTSKHKLRIQTEFLENNPNYIACTHRYNVVDQDSNIVQEIYSGPGRPESGDYKLNDFLNYVYYGHPGTLVFKNIFLAPKYDYSIIPEADRFVGDITLGLILSCLGNIYVLDHNMASYRMVSVKGGSSYVSSIAKQSQILKRIHFLTKLESYCKDEMNLDIKHADRSLYYVWWSILFMLRYPSRHNWLSLKKVFSLTDYKARLAVYIIKQLPEIPLILIKHIKKKFRIVRG